jgi:hypothetical protein
LLDADDLRIEGIMPGGSKSTFTLPVTSERLAGNSRAERIICLQDRAVQCQACRKLLARTTVLAGKKAA